jgi:hypothetical protein
MLKMDTLASNTTSSDDVRTLDETFLSHGVLTLILRLKILTSGCRDVSRRKLPNRLLLCIVQGRRAFCVPARRVDCKK